MSDTMFKISTPSLGLSFEMGTTDVPSDGRYHVLLRGDLVFSSKSRSKALAEYKKQRAALLPDSPPPARPAPAKIIKQMRVDADVRAMRSEWVSQFGNKSRKGGKGGRGGV